jgi:hypothetical protein
MDPVRTVGDVLTAMRAIDAALPDDDGVKWFNFLYMKVTEAVVEDTTGWQDRPFLERFDVAFADLYFQALTAWQTDPARTPHAWRPLLRARHDARVSRVQFALAGMNAHINRDLPVALAGVAEIDGAFPSRDGARHADFLRVNSVLEATEAAVRETLATGVFADLDRALGDADSLLAIWKVRQARESAWTNGNVLWQLRGMPALCEDYLTKLDQMTGFAGRGLLAPGLATPRSERSPD